MELHNEHAKNLDWRCILLVSTREPTLKIVRFPTLPSQSPMHCVKRPCVDLYSCYSSSTCIMKRSAPKSVSADKKHKNSQSMVGGWMDLHQSSTDHPTYDIKPLKQPTMWVFRESMLTACSAFHQHTRRGVGKSTIKHTLVLGSIPARLGSTAPRNTACTERLRARGFLCQKNPGILLKTCPKKKFKRRRPGKGEETGACSHRIASHLKINTYGDI